jgi:hypothetical protein
MSEKSIIELGRKLRELGRVVTIMPAVVKSVDEDELHCTVMMLDDTEVPQVRLKAAIDGITDGIVQIPSIDSTVLVGLIGNDTSTRFIVSYGAVDKVLFFNGDFGGLVKVESLVDRLNSIEGKVNDVITNLLTHTHTGVQTGAGVSGAQPPTVIANLSNTVRGDLENEKVKH